MWEHAYVWFMFLSNVFYIMPVLSHCRDVLVTCASHSCSMRLPCAGSKDEDTHDFSLTLFVVLQTLYCHLVKDSTRAPRIRRALPSREGSGRALNKFAVKPPIVIVVTLRSTVAKAPGIVRICVSTWVPIVDLPIHFSCVGQHCCTADEGKQTLEHFDRCAY